MLRQMDLEIPCDELATAVRRTAFAKCLILLSLCFCSSILGQQWDNAVITWRSTDVRAPHQREQRSTVRTTITYHNIIPSKDAKSGAKLALLAAGMSILIAAPLSLSASVVRRRRCRISFNECQDYPQGGDPLSPARLRFWPPRLASLTAQHAGPIALSPMSREWLHEIKHDGFRVIARKTDGRVRLYSRPGNDLTYRFPLIVEAIGRLRARSCIIDGETVACRDDGMADFNRIRYRQYDAEVFLYAFDLIELNGDDLLRDPLQVRKATLASVIARVGSGLRFNEHMEETDGPLVFQHACKLGLEGIVSKRQDSGYRSGRSPDWIKSKHPNAPAVKREAEEDW